MKIILLFSVFFILFLITNRITETRLIGRHTRRALDEYGESDSLPAELLLATMPKSRVFTDLSLPIPSKDGEEISLGVIAVTRAGIYIICRIQGEGLIENPNAARWRHVYNGSCTEFDNPFRCQAGARDLIEHYVKNAGLSAVKAHSLLVYTGHALRFTNPFNRSIVNAEGLARKIADLDRRGRLSRAEVRQTCRLLNDIGSGTYG